MNLTLKNALVYTDGTFNKVDLYVNNSKISFNADSTDNGVVVDCSDCIIVPGLLDVHVHLREPGFSYKETIKSGTKAAARGGFSAVCSMPNLNPTPDSIDNLKAQLDIINKDACINVYPYGTITKEQKGMELSDIDNLYDKVIAFTDDGRGVQDSQMMESAMKKAKAHNKIIAAHCEDNSLLNGGYIHDGEYAKKHNHKGICSESEYLPIKRDIELCKKTGCSYHVCHISTKESVEIIRNAKKQGIDISCETAPHYLILCDKDLQEDGRFKMNPPLRGEADKNALIEGILDGTIDMIATDHAPHSLEEKSKGLKNSMMGVVGIETSFSLMYTHFVKSKKITLEKLVELMSINPRKRFKIMTEIKENSVADFTVFDLKHEYQINPDDFLSMGKATPFKGMNVFGKCILTVANGKIAYQDFSERILENE